MSKRRLSPASLPPSKRLHGLFSSRPHLPSTAPITFDSALYDELILYIFSHLSWVDLCAAQATSKNWSRLASDNQLWKALYLREYGRSRLRGARGFIGRADGKETKPLPGRSKGEDFKDWKWMFRISSNWRTGRCTAEQFDGSSAGLPPLRGNPKYSDQTHILLAGSLTITASSSASLAPSVYLHTPNLSTHQLVCTQSRHSLAITTLALDQSPPMTGGITRVATFLSSGEFTVFDINPSRPSESHRKLVYSPVSKSARTSPIIQAVYHHPLLITLSKAFHLSLYDLSADTIRHTQTLTSFTSFPPSSLVLSVSSPNTYKLVLAYAIPVYPRHFSVGATELVISKPTSSSSPSVLSSPLFPHDLPSVEPMTVISTRTARAVDVPQGWIDENKLRSMREQWGRKVARVTDTQTDGKWVVLAPGDPVHSDPADLSPSRSVSPSPDSSPSPPSNSTTFASSRLHSATGLQLYRLSLPASSQHQHSWAPLPAAPPKLTFVRTLHGHTGPISALALADGRCVSLGVTGGIWVWDLEAGTGAEVAGPTGQEDPEGVRGDGVEANGTIVFDERRILTTGRDGVVVRRFDI